jgi:hypothetical protein
LQISGRAQRQKQRTSIRDRSASVHNLVPAV